ncbi:tetratricopeptide repeat protein [Isosphaeraceae bacterium EP7]
MAGFAGHFLQSSAALMTILLLSAGLARGQDAGRARLESEATAQAAEADRLFKAGDYAAALPIYQAERASRKILGDLRYESLAARAIGSCLANLRDFDGAIEAYLEVIPIDTERKAVGDLGYDWLLIGQAEKDRGRPADAVRALRKSIALLSKASEVDHEADAQWLYGQLAIDLNRADIAWPALTRGIQLAESLKDAGRLSRLKAELGRTAAMLGANALAAETFSDARFALTKLDRPGEVAEVDRRLADVLTELGNVDAASARAEMALEAHTKLEQQADLADDAAWLAALRIRQGRPADAATFANRAVEAFRAADDRPGEIAALVLLADARGKTNDWSAAAKALGEAVDTARQDEDPVALGRLLILAGEVGAKAGDRSRSEALFAEASSLSAKAKNADLAKALADAKLRSLPGQPKAAKPK